MTAAPAPPLTPPRHAWYTAPARATVRGTEVALRREGAGEPLLFLHGHWLTGVWSPFHRAVAAEVDLIAPELPGFGDSPGAEHLTTRPDMVLLLRDLLDALGLDAVHVAGYGIGAWLAADLAIWAPGRVRSLALVAPFGLRVPGSPVADVFAMDPARYTDEYFNGSDDGFTDLVPGVGTPAQGGPEGFAHRYGELGAAAAMIWTRRYDLKLEQRLPLLGVPALVVGARADRIVPDAHLGAWAGLLGAPVVDVDQAGHALLLQQPDAVASALTAFVRENAR
jgi:pimeloyl-ACP methyl ester carboxylesterase